MTEHLQSDADERLCIELFLRTSALYLGLPVRDSSASRQKSDHHQVYTSGQHSLYGVHSELADIP
jgi:hypothetical protein